MSTPAATTAFRYITGGTLPPDSPCYIIRPCDTKLLDLCRQGEFGYVLSSRQMGKSSLMARTVAALRDDGMTVAAIDLTTIGSQQVEAESWYLGVLTEIDSACMPQTDLFSWWEAHKPLPLAQRLWRYITEVLLPEVPGRIVVFVDEIDSTLSLDFTDDFFALIRSLHNQRAQQLELARLSFVLLGVASPSQLIRNSNSTPFNIGHSIDITDFTPEEASPLLFNLPGKSFDILNIIIGWTNGQPYLTQKLCALVSKKSTATQEEINSIVEKNILSQQGREDPHFKRISDHLLKEPNRSEKISECGKILSGKLIKYNEKSKIHNQIQLSGLIKKSGELLEYHCKIYKDIFNKEWISECKPYLISVKIDVQFKQNLVITIIVIIVVILFYQSKENLKFRNTMIGTSAVLSFDMDDEDIDNNYQHKILKSLANYHIKGEIEREMGSPNTTQYTEIKRALEKYSKIRGFNEGYWGARILQSSSSGKYTIKKEYNLKTNKYDLLIDKNFSNEPSRHFKGGIAENAKPAFNTEESLVAALGGDGFLRVWDTETGNLRAEKIIKNPEKINALGFSRENNDVLFFGMNGVIGRWHEFKDIEEKKIQIESPTSITSIALDGGNEIAATGHSDGTMRKWNTFTGRQQGKTMSGHYGWIHCIGFSTDGKLIASGGSDATIRLWNSVSNSLFTAPLKNTSGTIKSLSFIKGESSVVFGDANGHIALWRSKKNKNEFTLENFGSHSTGVKSIIIDNYKNSIISSDENNTSISWNFEEERKIIEQKYDSPAAKINSKISQPQIRKIAINPKNSEIIAGDSDGNITSFNSKIKGYKRKELGNHGSEISSIAISNDGKHIYSGGKDRRIIDWNFSKEPQKTILGEHRDWVLGIATDIKNEFVVSGGRDGTIKQWDAKKRLPITPEISTDQGAIYAIDISRDGKYIVSGGENGTVKIWERGTGQLIREHKVGKKDEDNGRPQPVYSVAISDDNSKIAAGGMNGFLEIFGIATQRRAIFRETETITSIKFSRDGSLIFTGGWSKEIKIWNSEKTKPIGKSLQGKSDSILTIAISPDDKNIFTGSDDGSIESLPGPAAWADLLCAKLPRNMSHKEWREWISPDIPYITQCPGLPIPAD